MSEKPVPSARRRAAPVHQPEGFKAEYDAFEPRFAAGVDNLMLAMFGIENRGGDASDIRRRLLSTLGGPQGPDVLEHGGVHEGYGPSGEIWFAYWRGPAAYDRWTAQSGIEELFADAALLDGPLGLWREYGLLSLDHHETSGSRPDDLTGIATIADAVAITEIHGYWGSARDRLVAAAEDPLDAELNLVPKDRGLRTLGVRLRVSPPHNICLIRTSQDVNRAGPEQMAWYRNEVEPTFLTGLRYLRENGEASGCIGGRFVIEKDDEGCDAGRSCAVAYFTSLGTLEAWTHRHPTHEAIMASFINMVRQFQGEPGLHLWHEVTVFPRGTLSGDYVNCTVDGGLLRLAADPEG